MVVLQCCVLCAVCCGAANAVYGVLNRAKKSNRNKKPQCNGRKNRHAVAVAVAVAGALVRAARGKTRRVVVAHSVCEKCSTTASSGSSLAPCIAHGPALLDGLSPRLAAESCSPTRSGPVSREPVLCRGQRLCMHDAQSGEQHVATTAIAFATSAEEI